MLKIVLIDSCRPQRRQKHRKPAQSQQQRHDYATDPGEHRKQHQLLVRPQNRKTLFDQLPTPRKSSHGALHELNLSMSSRKSRGELAAIFARFSAKNQPAPFPALSNALRHLATGKAIQTYAWADWTRSLFIRIAIWLQFISAGRTSCQQSPLLSLKPCLLYRARSCAGSSSTSPPRSL